jgi:SpoVK/Ycf46/Vps4 family AAA+-type ATPase
MEYYADSLQHLLAELERIDLLVRAQIALNRRIDSEDPQFRGLYISEQQVDTLLAHPRGRPSWQTDQGHGSEGTGIDLTPLDDTITQRREESLRRGIELRLEALRERFRLDSLDLDILLVCLAPELDLRYERLYAYLQDDVTRKRPSVDLVLSLLAPTLEQRLDGLHRFAPEAALFRHRLLTVVPDPANPDPLSQARTLKLDGRIIRYLLGSDEIDPGIRSFATRIEPRPAAQAAMDAQLWQRLAGLARSEWASKGAVIHLCGPYGVGKQQAAEAICRARSQPLVTVQSGLLAEREVEELEHAIALVLREAVLQPAPILWKEFDTLLDEKHRTRLQHFIRRLAGSGVISLLAGERPWQPHEGFGGYPFVQLNLPRPDASHRGQAWSDALNRYPHNGAELDLETLAARFRLTDGQVRDAAATAENLARWRDPDAPALTTQDLYQACRLHSNQKLASLASKIRPKYRWDDIVLPPDRLAQLREICNYVKYRDRVYKGWGFERKLSHGKGLAVLFAGPSGTGKTMAADIIAGELGLDLYKIDLSTVVSKYIGETEKNLSKIFNEAETSNAVLFFDEADALFGKRSEVKDSHDRYANIEIGYLLQRMEEYEGVVILATNFRKNMDEAFVRRLQVTVDFPFPGAEERSRIWEGIWPQATPRDPEMDLDFMARRFEVTGGNIRNIALAAAFLAADNGGRVDMGHLIRATQREYQKMGKVFTEKEFADFADAAPERLGEQC